MKSSYFGTFVSFCCSILFYFTVTDTAAESEINYANYSKFYILMCVILLLHMEARGNRLTEVDRT